VLLWSATGTFEFTELFEKAQAVSGLPLIMFLIYLGAVGKSAQFPLHAWLPDAMEGPTPVSALIHAATMVAAGVYLVVRVSPLFEAAPAARIVLLMLGAVSAAGAALAACAQTDIKRVLAYSTISQLGFMFAALGAGAWTPAMFHLTTHAAFKALLFLGAGSVIHAAKTQDMHAMGGLRRTMPFTFWTWVVGAAALAGVAPLSGFFSKDEIVASVGSFAPGIGALLLGTALLTAVYITRATMLTFADRRTPARGRESRFLMTAPLAFLAVPAAVLGLAGSAIAELVGGPEVHAPLWLPVVAGALALLGVGLAVAYWRGGVEADVRLEARTSLAWGLAKDGWRWDALVDALVARPTSALSGWLFRVLDRALIDRTVESVAPLARATGRGISRLHTGDGQWYAGVLTVAGALAAIAAVVMSR
jgi:NADH-quinone oxidoreductase subunit L